VGIRVPWINADPPRGLTTRTAAVVRATLDRLKKAQLLSIGTRVPPEILVVTWAVARRATSCVKVVHYQGIELRRNGAARVDDTQPPCRPLLRDVWTHRTCLCEAMASERRHRALVGCSHRTAPPTDHCIYAY
jgi:hypothetical protein